MKNKETTRMIFALLILIVFNGMVYAVEKKAGDSGGMQEIVDPIKKGKQAGELLSNYLKSCAEQYKIYNDELAQNEINMVSKLKKSTNDSEKVEAALEGLNKRIEILEKVKADFEFVGTKLKANLTKLGTLIGEIGGAASTAEKLSNQEQTTEKLIKEIEELQMKYREKKAYKPEEDTDAFYEWEEDIYQMKVVFVKKRNLIKNSLQSELLYKKLATALNMSKKNVSGWRKFSSGMRATFGMNQEDIAASIDRTKEYRDFVESTRVFHDMKDVSNQFQEIARIMKGMTGFDMPDIGDIGDLEPPVIDFENIDLESNIRTETEKMRQEQKNKEKK